MEVIGFLDSIEKCIVRGWAIHKANTNPVEVSIEVGDASTKVIANDLRLGVRDKGLHPTGHCAFSIDISDLVPTDTTSVLVSAKVDGKNLNGSPKRYILRQVNSNSKMLALIHIPKTAGTSVNNWISEKLNSDLSIIHVESSPEKHNRQSLSQYTFVSGHLIYGNFVKLVEDNFKLAVVLRDPMRQLISHINWVRNISNDVESAFFKNHTSEIKDLSLQLRNLEFNEPSKLQKFVNSLSHVGISLFDNCQTRYLINQYKRGQYIDGNNLTVAIRNLKNIDFVGETENLQPFIEQIGEYLEIDLEDKIQKLNIRSGESIISINEENKKILYPLVAIDYQLVEAAKQIIKKIAQ